MSKKRLFVIILGFILLAKPLWAQSFDKVEVRGAKTIAENDIIETCGPLTGVLMDEVERDLVAECLRYTGVFEKVAVKAQDDILLLEVSEYPSSPGRIDFGIMAVSGLGVSGTLSYEQFNLIPDTYLSTASSHHTESSSYDLAILRKDIGSQKLHFGLQAKGLRNDFDDRSYSTRVDQVEVFVGKQVSKELRLDFGLGYRDQRLYGLHPQAGAQLRAEAGGIYRPFLHGMLSYGNPQTWGELDAYLWNIGSDRKLIDLRLEAGALRSFSDIYQLHLGVRLGAVRGLKGSKPRLQDRGFLGGDSLRGFAPRGLGPKEGDDWLGGEYYAMTSLEVQRKIGQLSGQDVLGGLFADLGTVWSLSNNISGLVDDGAYLRASLGLSLNMTLSNIPLQVYLAKPIKSRAGDREQIFGLSARAQF